MKGLSGNVEDAVLEIACLVGIAKRCQGLRSTLGHWCSKFLVAIAHVMPIPSCIEEENKFLERD